MCGQSFFDLERINVLATYQTSELEIAINVRVFELTTNDDIFEATGDGAVPFGVKGSFVTSLQPFDTLGVGYECLCRLLRVIPVSLGELVAGHAKLATLTNGNDVSLGIDNLRASVGQNLSDGGQSCVDAVGGESIEASGRGLRET
jgi:hypothetical protein